MPPLDHDARVAALDAATDQQFQAAIAGFLLPIFDVDPADQAVMHDWRIAARTLAALVEMDAYLREASAEAVFGRALNAEQLGRIRARVKGERAFLAPLARRYSTERAQAERLCAELHPGTAAAARALIRGGMRPAEAKAELVRRLAEAGGQLSAPRQTRQRRGSGSQ